MKGRYIAGLALVVVAGICLGLAVLMAAALIASVSI